MTTTYYDVTYGNFQTSLYEEIRREAYGEDIGQNGWLTSDEQNKFISWLGLTAGKALLDVACGVGGPALRLAALTGCTVTGVDIHEKAISTARSLASQRGLESRTDFCCGRGQATSIPPKPASTLSPALMPSPISRITRACSSTGLDC